MKTYILIAVLSFVVTAGVSARRAPAGQCCGAAAAPAPAETTQEHAGHVRRVQREAARREATLELLRRPHP